jgi:hypothetical protein
MMVYYISGGNKRELERVAEGISYQCTLYKNKRSALRKGCVHTSFFYGDSGAQTGCNALVDCMGTIFAIQHSPVVTIYLNSLIYI